MRPLWTEALAPPGLAGPCPRRVAGTRGPRLPQPHRARHRALARHRLWRIAGVRSPPAASAPLRRVRQGPPRQAAGPPAHPAPPPASDKARATTADAAELLGSLGHEGAQRDPKWGGIGNNITPRFLYGVAETVNAVPHPERLEPRGAGF